MAALTLAPVTNALDEVFSVNVFEPVPTASEVVDVTPEYPAPVAP